MTKEEAIKVAGEMHGWLKTDREKEALETLIPELRESEDERVRKALVEYFAPPVPFTEVRGIPVQKVRDWLEKQKERETLTKEEEYTLHRIIEYLEDETCPSEWISLLHDIYCLPYEKQKGQKPAHTAKEMWKEMRLEVYAQASGNRHEPNYSDDSTKMFSLCDIDEIFEKIGNSTVEQKPAEWSEEDEANRDFILESLEDQIKFCKKDAEGAYYAKQIRAAQNWLKSLPLNLKKKNEDVAKLCSNEWSEEDEKIAKEIEEELWYPGDFPDYPSKEESELYDDCQRRLDWFKNKLKSLRSQPKQEWSGEDERKLQKCIKIVERWEEDYDIAYAPYSNILKSLRPQPKKELSIEKAIQWLDDNFYFSDNSSGRGLYCEITTHGFDSLEEMYDSFRKAVTVDSEPHWKPSEEQIKAIRLARSFVVDDFDEHPTLSEILMELEEQLKKLM